MQTAFDRVIDAFNSQGLHVKTLGQGKASAQAPGHSKADQSVSVTDIGGRVLVWSHSDPTDAVLSSLGLSMSDLFDEPRGVRYDYPDGRQVFRTPQKKFRQGGNTKGDALYRADRLPAASTVFVVEGEQDVHTLESVGVVATCPAMGAGKAHLFDWTPLHGKAVYIVRDMDDVGLLHARAVAGILAGHADVVILEPIEGKDASDHIASGHSLAEFVPMADVEPLAPPAPVDPEFEALVEHERRRTASQVEARRRDAEEAAGKASGKLHPKTLGEILDTKVVHDWLVPDLLERGDRLVITGGEGSGKSHLLRQIAIAISAGVHPFEQRTLMPPRKVLVIDAENSEQQWARGARYVTSHVSRLGKGDPRSNVIVSAGIRPDLTLQSDINEVHALLDKHKPDLLYVGPLYKLVPKGLESNDDAAQMILTLDSFRERGICLLLEAHAGHVKSLGGDRDLRPRGASALMGWPEFGFGLRPVEGDESLATVVKWRGDREQRDWPTHLRRGTDGELPWMPAYMPHL